ncbi:MAG: EutN/CcmL family microcompartment protein [Pirellulaceae bacterium]
MQTAKVVGTTYASVKHRSFTGQKILVVQPYMVGGKEADGYPLLAIDGVGAGKDDEVIITSDGRHARELLNADATPVRWTIIGIQDE